MAAVNILDSMDTFEFILLLVCASGTCAIPIALWLDRLIPLFPAYIGMSPL